MIALPGRFGLNELADLRLVLVFAFLVGRFLLTVFSMQCALSLGACLPRPRLNPVWHRLPAGVLTATFPVLVNVGMHAFDSEYHPALTYPIW